MLFYEEGLHPLQSEQQLIQLGEKKPKNQKNSKLWILSKSIQKF